MSDQIDRAADLLWDAIDDKGIEGRLYRQDCHYITDTLHAAGLLASPEHDAEVAARTLREAESDAEVIKVHAGGGNLVTGIRALTVDALRARADRIAGDPNPYRDLLNPTEGAS